MRGVWRETGKDSEIKLKWMAAVTTVVACAVARASTPAFAAAPRSPRINTVSLLLDQGWDGDASIIWYDDFDGSEDLRSRYLEHWDDEGDCAVIGYEALGGSGKSLRGRWQVGEVNAGNIKKCFGRSPIDYRGLGVRKTEDFRDVYWRMYVKHQPGWTGNPAKLSRASAFAGSNWSQAMIAHIWGGAEWCNSELSLVGDPARGVDASSHVVTQGYNDFANLTWLGILPSAYPIFDTSESGRWVCVEGHVRLNTPGASDGIFTLYIDGQVGAHRDDLNWVYSWQDYGINAIFLEHYWNEGSPVEQERYFDDFVISTSYVGLAKSPLNPTVWKTAFRDDDAGDAQSAWQLQAAADLHGADIVWDSGMINGPGDVVVLDANHGVFQGSLAGRERLDPDAVYALRTRRRDSTGDWSDWSPWMTTLRTDTVAEPAALALLAIGGLALALGRAAMLRWRNRHAPSGPGGRLE